MKDLVFALRGLRRAPAFATAALLTLALGIGSAAAIFSVAYGVLLRPLPFADPDRLMEISIDQAGTAVAYGSLSAPEYSDLARGTRSFANIGAWSARTRTLSSDGKSDRITAALVTKSLFDVLDIPAKVGRTFAPEEDVPGASGVVVLGDDLWQRRFGGDPSVIGKSIEIDAIPRTVIGVLPAGVRIGGAEVFLPLGLDPARLPGRGAHFLFVIGRLRAGVSLAQARNELSEFAKRSVTENPMNYGKKGFTSTARPLREAWYGNARPTMVALMTAVLLLLLLAAINVANLLLVRAEARQREMGVRVAMGASPRRLVRQLLTESALLAALGALIGVPLAALAVRSLLAINPGVLPPGAEVSLDGTVVVVILGAVAVAALVAGVAPALKAGSQHVQRTIASGTMAGGRAGTRLRSTLVGIEVGLAAVMLIGAGLVGRSLQKLLSVDPGFDQRNAFIIGLALPPVRYDTTVKTQGFIDRALQEIRALPGVTAAATASILPLATAASTWSVEVEGRPDAVRELSSPYFVTTTGEVFRAMGIRIVRGRAFGPEDRETSLPVTIISEAMAKEYWPGEDPIGKRIHPSGPIPWMTVVGVAADVRPQSLSAPPRAMYYMPTAQFAALTGVNNNAANFVIRTNSDPRSHINGAREVIRSLDPNLALNNVRTLEAVVMGSVARPRFVATVLGTFGASALLLAIIGVYGVLSYAMERRRRELAMRMALGAQPGQVQRLVIQSGLAVAVIGLAAGLSVAVLGNKVIAELLYQVSPTDPVTIVTVTVGLLGAALLASWVPARRATRVSPAEVLRGE